MNSMIQYRPDDSMSYYDSHDIDPIPFEKRDMSQREKTIDTVKSLSDDIVEKNSSILKLISERNYLIESMIRTVQKVSYFEHFTGIDYKKFMDDWNENGFNSDSVKTAVRKIRGLFMDDGDRRYAEYVCCSISESYLKNTGLYAGFHFSNKKNPLSIYIPAVYDGRSYISPDTIEFGRILVTMGNILKYRSYDIDRVRKYIGKYIDFSPAGHKVSFCNTLSYMLDNDPYAEFYNMNNILGTDKDGELLVNRGGYIKIEDIDDDKSEIHVDVLPTGMSESTESFGIH